MQPIEPRLLEALRSHIGNRGLYQDQEYELIEVLEHDCAVVLRDCSAAQTIQSDMHGEAHRMVSKTHTVPVFSEVDSGFHPVLHTFFDSRSLQELEQTLTS